MSSYRINDPYPLLPGWLDELASATLEHIADDLSELLTRHPGARRTLIHLSVIENTLRYKDRAAAHRLPFGVLQGALLQLEAIGFASRSTGLTILRLRLMQALLRHGATAAPVRAPLHAGR
jgi:hypothetical protein